MFKKILSSILSVIVISTTISPSVFAEGNDIESKTIASSSVTGSETLQSALNIKAGNDDMMYQRQRSKLIYKEGEQSLGNWKIKESTNSTDSESLLGDNGSIGIFSPGDLFYAPYVPLEFQVNIPVGYKKGNESYINYIPPGGTTLQIPIASNNAKSGMEVTVYGLTADGKDLLGFDVYNSNVISNYKSKWNENLNVAGYGSIGDSQPQNSNRIPSLYPDSEGYSQSNFGYLVKKAGGDSESVLLGKMNFGASNGDNDYDGIAGNGFFNGSNGFKISSDMLIGSKNTSNLYKNSLFYSPNNTLPTPDFYNSVSGSGTYNGESLETSANPDSISAFFLKPDDFLLTYEDGASFGVQKRIFGHGGTNSALKKTNGFIAKMTGDVKDIDCLTDKPSSLESIKDCISDGGNEYGLKYFALELSASGTIINIFKSDYLENELSGSGRYILPLDAQVKNPNTGAIEYDFSIPVLNTDFEKSLNEKYNFIDIGNSLKFIEYPILNNKKLEQAQDTSTIIYVPYLLSSKRGALGKVVFQKNLEIIKNSKVSDIYFKILGGYRDNQRAGDLASFFAPKKFDSGITHYEPLFTDGGKYVMDNFGVARQEDNFKIISYNPNIIPYTVVVGENQSTLGRNSSDPRLTSLDFTSFGKRFSLGSLFAGTPISEAYVQKQANGDTVYYKTFIVQLKVFGDVSLGTNDNTNLFIGDIAKDLDIGTNPYIFDNPSNPYKSFLSVSTRKGSIGFPIYGDKSPAKGLVADVFTPKGKDLFRFNEVDGDNTRIDGDSFPAVDGYKITLKDKANSGSVFMNLDTTAGSSVKDRLTIEKPGMITIKTPQCPTGYSIYQNYKPFFDKLYSDFDSEAFNPYVKTERLMTQSGSSPYISSSYEKTSLLYLLNTPGVNRNNREGATTTYFNYPKPFCVNNDWGEKVGGVNNLNPEDIAYMLQFYVLGIDKSFVERVSSKNVSSKITETAIPSSYITSNNNTRVLELNGSGSVSEEVSGSDFIIHPINIDQLKFSEDSPDAFKSENVNIASGLAESFYDNYVKNSFDKLFITKNLIPEFNAVSEGNGVEVSEMNSQNNLVGYNNKNSFLAKVFKLNTSTFPSTDLILLGSTSKHLFPVIGAEIVFDSVKNINYCSGTDYYLGGSCFSSVGEEREGVIAEAQPKDKNGISVVKGTSTFDFTKIGRVLSSTQGINAPITSGTTFYQGFINENGAKDGQMKPSVGFSILNSSGFNNLSVGANSNTVMNAYGRNIGGNIYSFLRLGASDKKELGMFSNDNIKSSYIVGDGSINTGSGKIAAYPFMSSSDGSYSAYLSFSDANLNSNIIKTPLYILRSKPTNDDFNTIEGTNNDSIDRVVNNTIKAYWSSTFPVEEAFEKRHGEYGIYVSLKNNPTLSFGGENEIDPETFLKYNNNNNSSDYSRLLTINYSKDFAVRKNGIQLSIEASEFDSSCLSTNKDKNSECRVKYVDSVEGEIIKTKGIPAETAVTKTEDCNTNPLLPECQPKNLKKPRASLSDQFTLSQINDRNTVAKDALSVGSGTLLGNALKFSSFNNTSKSIPEFTLSGGTIKTSNGMLARKNIEIEQLRAKGINDIGLVTDYAFVGNTIEESLKNSINYNSLYSDDPVIITNGRQYYNGASYVAGGYLNATGKIDTTYGAILDNWTYSDNDNLWEDNTVATPTVTPGIDNSQNRRNRIRDEIGSGNHAAYTAIKLPASSFNSINGILRISKDSRKYFSNLTIQSPISDQTQLLNEVPVSESIFSYNNIVLKYGNRYWTWGNNDTSCNGIDPNAVYDRIDMYTGGKSGENGTRSDTITACLVNVGNEDGLVSDKNELTESLELLIPIKPARGLARIQDVGGSESSFENFISAMNDINSNHYGHFRPDNIIENGPVTNPTKRYYVGNIDNYSSNSIAPSINVSVNTPTSTFSSSPYGMSISTYQGISYQNCRVTPSNTYCPGLGTVDVSQTPLKFITSYVSSDPMIKNLPQVYMNGLTIKGDSTPGVKSLKVGSNITFRKSYSFVFTPTNKNIRRETAGAYADWAMFLAYREVGEIVSNNAFGKRYSETMRVVPNLASPASKQKLDDYVIDYVNIPKYDINTYKNEMTFTSEILDSFKKTGNIGTVNSIGNITNNTDNYIVQSLREQEGKVSVGDILTQKITINSNLSSVPLQNFIVSQTIDRGFDLIPDSLHLYGTNLGKDVNVKPIYNDTAEFKTYLKADTDTEFSIFNLTTGKNQPFKKSTSSQELSLSDRGDEIIVRNGVLYLELIDNGGANITSNSSIRYIRGGEIKEDNVNGLYSKVAETDILDGGYSRLVAGDIIMLKAGENIARTTNSSAAPRFRIRNFNNFTDSLLAFNINTLDSNSIDTSSNVFGISPISRGLSLNSTVTPKYSQSEYYYYSINGDCPKNGDILTATGAKTFEGVAGTYCRAYNKHMDYIYKGYLQMSSPYNRLVLPDTTNPFYYGGLNSILSIDKFLNGNKIPSTLRNTEFTTDKDKLLLVNIGKLAGNDTITLEFDVRVNDENKANNSILATSPVITNALSDTVSSLVKNDTIIDGSIHSNANAPEIYSHSKNTKLFYIHSSGKEEIVYNKEIVLPNSLTFVPKTNISIVNLSGRNNYYTCDPVTSSAGNCKKITTLDTYDKNDNASENGMLSYNNFTRYPESTIPLYKGQKILVRMALSKKGLSQANVKLAYDTNYLIFENTVYTGNQNGALEVIKEGSIAKNSIFPGNVNFGLGNKVNSTKVQNETKKQIELRNGKNWAKATLSGNNYNEISYNVDTADGVGYVDFLFTVKFTGNSESLKNVYSDSFNQKVLSSVIGYVDYTKNTPNTKYSSVSSTYPDYLRQNPAVASNNAGMSQINRIYYSIPFNAEYTTNSDTRKTDFNPSTGNIKVRYFDEGSSNTAQGDQNTGLAIELSNTSTSGTAETVGNFNITIPFGFDISSVRGYRLVSTDEFNANLNEENFISGFSTTENSYSLEEKLNKRILRVHPEGLTLEGGRRYTLYVYLTINRGQVDPYSSFSVEGSIGSSSLFADTAISYKPGMEDTVTKTLPTFGENNVFYGNRYSKNTINSDNYLNNNSGESKYYIIGENGKPVIYDSSKLEDIKYIDSNNKPKLILNMNTIVDDTKNTYSVETLSNGLINPNGQTYEFTNNTVYYYDGDINIGDPATNSGTFDIIFNDNMSKPGKGGVTIIASGKIFVNTNIETPGLIAENISSIRNVGFIGLKGTAFHPRVHTVEGFFYSPLSANSVVGSDDINEGIISTGYANESLKFNGGVYSGLIWNERNQGCGTAGCVSENGLSGNQVENFTFNSKLYLNPPPVFRKK